MSSFLEINDSISNPVDIAKSSIANIFNGSSKVTWILLFSKLNGISVYFLHRFSGIKLMAFLLKSMVFKSTRLIPVCCSIASIISSSVIILLSTRISPNFFQMIFEFLMLLAVESLLSFLH